MIMKTFPNQADLKIRAKTRLINEMILKGYRVYNVEGRKPYVFWLDIFIHEWFPNLVFVRNKPEEE